MYEQHVLNDPSFAKKVSFQQFVDTYEGQLNALMIELRIILVTFLALILAGLEGSDDEPLHKTNWAYRQVYKIGQKTLSELLYFYDPTSLTGLVDSGVPAFRTITQAFNIVTNGADSARDFMMGENYKGILQWEIDPNDKKPPMSYTLPFFIHGYRGLKRVIEIEDSDKVQRVY
jgi:hypothetical protein